MKSQATRDQILEMIEAMRPQLRPYEVWVRSWITQVWIDVGEEVGWLVNVDVTWPINF